MSAARLLLRVGQKTLWNPLALGPNVLSAWWNADLHGNTAYMTDDGGGLISSWSSMNSKIAVTGATSARPTWTSGAWVPSGKAGLTFNGTANCLVSTSFAALPLGSTPGEIWALFTDTGATGGATEFICEYGSGASTASNRASRTAAGNPRSVGATDGATATASPPRINVAAGGTIARATFGGTSMTIQLDGGTPVATTIATLSTTGTRLRIGARNIPTADLFWNGVLRHIMVTTALTNDQQLQMFGFLAWDGWLSAAANPLAVTHRYKYAPP